jgi:hypothetical protein
MWDDDDLEAALRAELAHQAPPTPLNGLVDVMARGRRRRRRRQLGTALATVVAVAGVTTAVVSAGALPSGQDVAATGTSSTGPATEAPWPRADLPARTPHTTWTPAPTAPPPAGRPTEPVPRCEVPDTSDRDLAGVRPDHPALQNRLWRAWNTVSKVPVNRTTSPPIPGTGTSPVAVPDGMGLLIEQKLPPSRPNTHDTFTYTADLSDAEGTGSVVLTFGRFTGTPLSAADDQAYDTGNCQPPKRHVLPDGTVLQLYDAAPSDPFASLTRTLRIYLPDGQLHSLTARNYGSPDFTTNREDPGHPHRTGPGRPTLPLTEAQFAELALALVG